MYSTVFLLLLMAFYLLYSRSARVKVVNNKTAVLNTLHKYRRLSLFLSMLLLSLAGILGVYLLGVGAGIFGCIVVLMGVGSLVIILAPFRYFRMAHLFVLYMFLLVFEVFIF